jgi:hypothetical protein
MYTSQLPPCQCGTVDQEAIVTSPHEILGLTVWVWTDLTLTSGQQGATSSLRRCWASSVILAWSIPRATCHLCATMASEALPTL